MSTGKRILIVEDEVLIALDMERMLAHQGHAVEVATSVAAADAILATMEFDLAVLDYQLQDGTTIPLAGRLKAMHVPFVICSGTTGLEELADAFRNAPVLAKPFTTETFPNAVTNAADRAA